MLGNQCWLQLLWGWMVGRIWQQEEKWFLRKDRESSKCLGLCLACLWDLPRHKGEAFHGSVVGCGTELSLSPQLLEAGRCRGSHLRAEWSGNLVRAAQTSQPCAEGLTSAPAAPVGSTERVVLGTECAYSVPSESICGWEVRDLQGMVSEPLCS